MQSFTKKNGKVWLIGVDLTGTPLVVTQERVDGKVRSSHYQVQQQRGLTIQESANLLYKKLVDQKRQEGYEPTVPKRTLFQQLPPSFLRLKGRALSAVPDGEFYAIQRQPGVELYVTKDAEGKVALYTESAEGPRKENIRFARLASVLTKCLLHNNSLFVMDVTFERLSGEPDPDRLNTILQVPEAKALAFQDPAVGWLRAVPLLPLFVNGHSVVGIPNKKWLSLLLSFPLSPQVARPVVKQFSGEVLRKVRASALAVRKEGCAGQFFITDGPARAADALWERHDS
jgi:hypothetical protein